MPCNLSQDPNIANKRAKRDMVVHKALGKRKSFLAKQARGTLSEERKSRPLVGCVGIS